jgi:hypothetical protein
MPISSRIGPLTTMPPAIEEVLLDLAVIPVEAMARITGRYSALAPAITALTATFSTVSSHGSRYSVGLSRPTISSGAWLVPSSIAATRSSVGSMIGRKSVQRFSSNRRLRFSSVSGSSNRGVDRSNVSSCGSLASSGVVSCATTPSMNGRPVTGSSPSTNARSSSRVRSASVPGT